MGSLLDLAAHFSRAARRLEHEGSQHALRRAGNLLLEEIKSAIGSYRYGWPELAASTVEQKGADTPLYETGGYQHSFQVVLGHHEAWIGTNDPKVKWLEYGTGRMPPRPVLSPALLRKEAEVAATFAGVLHAAVTTR